MTIGIWHSDRPSPGDVNNRRQAIIQDRSLLPVISREIPNFADAAIWVWAGGHLGALYAFKGGTSEVAVKISGITEDAALNAAKKFATRASGSIAKTGFAYTPPESHSIDDKNHKAAVTATPGRSASSVCEHASTAQDGGPTEKEMCYAVEDSIKARLRHIAELNSACNAKGHISDYATALLCLMGGVTQIGGDTRASLVQFQKNPLHKTPPAPSTKVRAVTSATSSPKCVYRLPMHRCTI